MKEKGNSHDEAIRTIKMDIPNFVEKQFLDTIKIKFSALYRSIKTNHTSFIDTLCTKDYLKTILKNKSTLLKLDDDIDFINIQNAVIKDYRSKGEYDEVDVDIFVFYIDYMANNKENAIAHKKRYFDMAYKITLQAPFSAQNSTKSNICPRCGATLSKNLIRYSYICDYCNFEKFINYDEWKISNIQKL